MCSVSIVSEGCDKECIFPYCGGCWWQNSYGKEGGGTWNRDTCQCGWLSCIHLCCQNHPLHVKGAHPEMVNRNGKHPLHCELHALLNSIEVHAPGDSGSIPGDYCAGIISVPLPEWELHIKSNQSPLFHIFRYLCQFQWRTSPRTGASSTSKVARACSFTSSMTCASFSGKSWTDLSSTQWYLTPVFCSLSSYKYQELNTKHLLPCVFAQKHTIRVFRFT